MKKRIVILGSGESGTGAALLAKAKGYDVFVSDFGSIKPEFKALLQKESIDFEEGKHSEQLILNAESIVKSPGISPEVEIVQKAMSKGIKVIDELEFAFQYTRGKIIAITGTNGKSTTTMMTYHLMQSAGLSVGLGGNIGKSMAAQLVSTDYDFWVLECSSFQIDGFVTLRPYIAVLLNITADHLDRYQYKLENYVKAKFALFKNQTADEYCLLFADDELIAEHRNTFNIQSKIYELTFQNSSASGAYCDGESLNIQLSGEQEKYPIEQLPVKGKHNQINAMASILSAKLSGVKSEKIKSSLPKFTSIQHRLELIGEIHGVQFVNDSKATNVDAVYYALEAYKQPIVWIVGGVDKGNDYSKLDRVLGQVKAIICLGKDNQKIKEYYKEKCSIIEETQSMQGAVQMGYQLAKDREVVLLSPACASFDLFRNYEDRGNQFRLAFQALEREVALKKL